MSEKLQTWKLNDMLLNNQYVTENIKWEIKGGGEGRGEGGEMTQTLYAHMNKRKKKGN
jgi:hypothetical protein